MPERADDQIVLVSGIGDLDTGGGLFVLDADGPRRIDRLSTTGLAVAPGGRRLARLLRDAGDQDSAGELLVYDDRGVELYRRVDELGDAHDAIWHDGHLVVASASTNTILWLDDGGRVARRWSPGPNGDAWHLNCLTVRDGRLLACAFGRFDHHRAWAVPGAAEGAGIVFDLETGEDVLTGLTCPHHPKPLGDNRWIVCDSHGRRLLVLDATGALIEAVPLGAWTRGLAISDEHVYVGLSADRKGDGSARAHIAMLDRERLAEVQRWPLPVREIYDVALAPRALAAALERGFRTNALRAEEAAQASFLEAAGVDPDGLWAMGDPLPPDACAVDVSAEVPPVLTAGAVHPLAFSVRNRAGELLVSAQPHPVLVSWRWFTPGGDLVEEGDRVPLRPSLGPGATMTGTLPLRTPAQGGTHVLRITLVQELIRWFDDVDPANALTATVAVG